MESDECLLHDSDSFNLFLLALRRIQEQPEDESNMDPMSYFQIVGMQKSTCFPAIRNRFQMAAIHGLPRGTWELFPAGLYDERKEY
jgi:hypothetical protein